THFRHEIRVIPRFFLQIAFAALGADFKNRFEQFPNSLEPGGSHRRGSLSRSISFAACCFSLMTHLTALFSNRRVVDAKVEWEDQGVHPHEELTSDKPYQQQYVGYSPESSPMCRRSETLRKRNVSANHLKKKLSDYRHSFPDGCGRRAARQSSSL